MYAILICTSVVIQKVGLSRPTTRYDRVQLVPMRFELQGSVYDWLELVFQRVDLCQSIAFRQDVAGLLELCCRSIGVAIRIATAEPIQTSNHLENVLAFQVST
jgi:hypothetical protein